jgi:uncharacterized membrane protein
MNRQVGIAVLVLVTGSIVMAAILPLLPVREERFSELGILGPGRTVGNYPRNVKVNQSFLLYGLVENHQGAVESYRVLAKSGNRSTAITNNTYANAPVIATYWHILVENQTWVFPMNLTINHSGIATRLIFELWSYNVTDSAFEYTGLWNQVWLDVLTS